MIVSMTLELKDIPGQLVLALSPISELHGNIMSVVHQHEEKTPRGTIPVQITFEIDQRVLDELIERLEKSGVRVARVGEERLRSSVSLVLIGHIIHSDIGDTIDRIDSTGFAEVVDLSLSMPAIDRTSSAYLVISATGEKELKKSLEILRDVADKKDLLMIEPIRLNSEGA
ncbi:ACT-domain-containing protein, predicted allosteric regulator of homoserine dehydrogenase [Candidatus Methanoperedens nitroreducens]|uniref:ACT-domain-containing protein, predicted allosteric regulator of homoserine dehydrogenase n=1 Tax=Candidatus Methanoperedens nitratireducens TaxID=1392998 RepID=A0A062V6Y0_9EURY|nr:amino acid-binding protein [Candidatus Methanoperedens nitroreducens]KCZ72333.1 ACT-domain-containing protein, predicted allosteric regulator of homoserine dehydrogenase [Candidatus Methanoperedens nitroreducens]MDJ1423733.1 amino acid-binding protein [Candidatus Methanoperedens sp.]